MAGSDVPIYMLVGGGGVPNYGDELIIWKWLNWIRGKGQFPDHKIVLELNHRKVGESLGYNKFYDTFLSGDIASARKINSSERFAEMFDRGATFFDKTGGHVHARRLAERLSRTRIFHMHGGGYLNDYWPFHAFSMGLACAAKEKFDCRAVATGLGLGPFSSDESLARVREAAGSFDYFEVRDKTSKEMIGNFARQGLDDVFLSPVEIRTVPGRVLHISLIGKSDRELVESSISKSLIDRFDSVYFWICSPQDAQNYSMLGNRYRHIIPLTIGDLLTSVPVGSSNYMLTERFHPHLIGARLGFGGAYVSRSGYYNAKHGSVADLGSNFDSVSLGDSIVDLLDGSQRSTSMAVVDPEFVFKKNQALAGAILDS